MVKLLYGVGALSAAIGIFLVVSSLSRSTEFSDVVMLIGAPTFMNGMTLFTYGFLLLCLGRMLELLNQMAKKTIWLDAWADEEKVLVKCPKCAQQLRVASGKDGMLNCPKCGNKFEAKT
jgi:uncharacterized Zn-finger protein